MGHIIRNRLLPGCSAVDGNNPYTIQGHPVSTRVEGQSSGIRDYMDLTDQILEIPRELSHYRYDSPLMGGSHTVKNHSGPVNDYLATQYLSTEPKQGYMGPENRPAETPDITIGKGGTIDVILNSTIVTAEKARGFDAASPNVFIKSVWYNLTDFDDPNAPAYPIKINPEAVNIEVKFLPPEPDGKLNKIADVTRVVGYVKLKPDIINLINAQRALFRSYGGNPCEIRQTVGWFEMQVVKSVVDVTVKVRGASPSNDGNFSMLHDPKLYDDARVPPERIWIEYPTATDKNISLPPVAVPIWDIVEIEDVGDVVNDEHTTTVKYVRNHVEKSVAIKTQRNADAPRDYRVTPMRPIFPKNQDDPVLEHIPYLPPSVFPYIRIEGFPESGGRYEAFAPELTVVGRLPDWGPNKTVTVKYKLGGKDRTIPFPYGYTADGKSYLLPPFKIEPDDPVGTQAYPVSRIGRVLGVTYKLVPDVAGVTMDAATGTITVDGLKVLKDSRDTDTNLTVSAEVGPTTLGSQAYAINIPKIFYKNDDFADKTLDIDPEGSKSWPVSKIEDHDGVMYVQEEPKVAGFEVDPNTGKIVGRWSEAGAGVNPKTVYVTAVARCGPSVLDTETFKFTVEAMGAANGTVLAPSSQKSVPVSCTRITASVVRKPCRGPEDLMVIAQFSDGTTRELSTSEYRIVRSSAKKMTIAYGDEPAIVTDVSLQ